jgi:hypothetical protein
VARDWKENTVFREGAVECLMLALQRNAVWFKPHMKASTFRMLIERTMKSKANFNLAKNVDVPFIPPSISGTLLLNKNAVA